MRNIFLIIALLNTLFLFGGSKEIGCMVIQPIETSCMEPPHEAFYFMEANEVWKDVVGYEGVYVISKNGAVKRLNSLAKYSRWGKPILKNIREKVMSPHKTTHGYLMVCLSKGGVSIHATIHRLVAITFIPNPENKPFVNHKNGIKTDNRVENLEWVTASENAIHARVELNYKNKKGADNQRSISVYQYTTDFIFVKKWGAIIEADREGGYSSTRISATCKGFQKTHKGYIWSFQEIKNK